MPLGMALTGLSTLTAGILSVAGGLALTALYLLRRRRERLLVPFIPLWFSSAGGNRSERLARRVRRWGSLALQLAIFAFILLAAVDPSPSERDAGGRTVVVLLDRSASMQARDEPGTRLGRARTLARDIIDELGSDDRALIASFAGSVTAATGIEEDRARLRAAVDAVRPSNEPGDLPAALIFASTVLSGRPRPTLILISDGGGGDAGSGAGAGAAVGADVGTNVGPGTDTPLLHGIDVRFLPVGRRRDNVAIVAFAARRLPADPTSIESTLVVQSFRTRPTDVTVAITAGPQRIPLARRRLHLEPGARIADALSGVAVPDARLEAVLEDAHDDLPLDDRAFAVVPEPARVSVLVVGGPNLYLEGALLGLGKAIRVEHVAPDAVEASRSRWSDTDVVIFDGVTPDPAPATGRFLYLDPHGPANPWPDRGAVADPVVTDVLRAHPLTKQLGLTDLNVASARRLTLSRDDVAVASAPGAPLIVARTRAGLKQVAVAFDLRRSDLPMRSAFPLFLANVLTWLANRPAGEALSWPTGRTVRVDVAHLPGSQHRGLDVVAPDGTRSHAPILSGAVTVTLDQVGFFDLIGANGQGLARLAANLASPPESDLEPRATLRVGDRTPPPPDPRPRQTAPRREWWLWAAAAALALCTGEWLSFHRRLTV